MDKTLWTPADLLQLSGGYWSACALHASVRLDIFTPLVERSLTAEELAGILESDVRGTRMLLNALTALELTEKIGDKYASTPFAAKYLCRASRQFCPEELQTFLRGDAPACRAGIYCSSD